MLPAGGAARHHGRAQGSVPQGGAGGLGVPKEAHVVAGQEVGGRGGTRPQAAPVAGGRGVAQAGGGGVQLGGEVHPGAEHAGGRVGHLAPPLDNNTFSLPRLPPQSLLVITGTNIFSL